MCKTTTSFIVSILISEKTETIIIRAISMKQSLILLKTKALNAALSVPTLVDQKFIKKKEVIPIISQPKYKTTKLAAKTNITMLITKESINKISRLVFGSYRN